MNNRQALVLCLCVSSLLLWTNAARAQDKQEQVTVNNVSRAFLVHLPRGYDSQRHYPVVLLLPGRQQEAEDMARFLGFNDLADRNGIIAVYPSPLQGRWNIGVSAEKPSQRGGGGRGYPPMGGGRRGRWPGPGGSGGSGDGQSNRRSRPSAQQADDVWFVEQMIQRLGDNYSIDSSRIYATGLSDGGFMDFQLGCRLTDRIAAIAPVGAAMPKSLSCTPSRLLPVLMINGTSDPVVPYKGGSGRSGTYATLSAEDSAKTWAKFNNCDPGKVQRTTLKPKTKGGHKTEVEKYECKPDAEIMLYSVKGGGNTWPGGGLPAPEKQAGKTSRDLDANEVIWKFFAAHSLPAQATPGS